MTDKIDSNSLFLNFWKYSPQVVEFSNFFDDQSNWIQIIEPAISEIDPRLPNTYLTPPNKLTTNCNVNLELRSVMIPFNLKEVTEFFLEEMYINQEPSHRVLTNLRKLFYILKPLTPRFIQLGLRRKFASTYMAKKDFPTWPIDISLDEIYRSIFGFILQLNEDSSLPILSFWPNGYNCCVVLTHDVEQQIGFNHVEKLADLETKHGFRSSWNFVPRRYKIEPGVLSNLRNSGFEIGVHGLYHDGKLFQNLDTFINRAKIINEYMHDWECQGFRSPSAIRNLQWISQYLDASYDSSSVTSEQYGAQPGGCCTVFPFFVNKLVELPITMQQDHTLLEILGYSPQQMLRNWIDTYKSIRRVNGMVLLITHPDYMLSVERVNVYKDFLKFLQNEENCWFALPHEVAYWWRQRHLSQLTIQKGNLEIDGPAQMLGGIMVGTNVQNDLKFHHIR